MDESRRIADYLRSTADLIDYFRTCKQTGDLALVESALRDMPEWATFHEVKSALGAAGLRLGVAPLGPVEKVLPEFAERRKGPRKH
ncbi:hypothetical protein [Cognatilysobacter lacus]|uniref:Uncharacterized protein n=1 Tax=Cognatilysobacter lacus TaxID=1643323 RepID=A0A5D8Z4R9_9GAMM|nr:hypothetical protein [Lysobacter lacus]TZF89657.1 hypothetical protein FW784_08410 [Lysobacter lacus]